MFLFCLFWGFPSHSRIFHSYGDVTITSEGLQILTDSRHFWQLSSEDSLSCHAYCDTGHPFIMVFSEDPWHSHLLPSAWQWNCHWLVCRDRGSTSRGERSTAGPPLRWHAYEADKSNEYTFFLSTFCLSVDFSHFFNLFPEPVGRFQLNLSQSIFEGCDENLFDKVTF